MTLAKVSSAQCAAGTSVPSFQHEGDCISPPRAQSIWESLGYQHAVLEGEHVEVRVTLLFFRRAAQSSSLELRGIPLHGKYVLQPSTTGREWQCLVQHQPLTPRALPASPQKLFAIYAELM